MQAPAPNRPIETPRWKLSAGLATAAGLCLIPWWRNHTLLGQPYDWSMYVTAVGKWEAGLKPYVDYDTPLQSGSILAGWAAEKIFGAHYLALTYGNAVLIVAALLLAWALLRHTAGHLTSLVAAAGITILSVGQHTIPWYNPLATLAILAVTWSLATWPAERRQQWFHLFALVGGLVVGGITKLNFHFVALAFASGLVVFHGLSGRWRWSSVGLAGAALLFFGLVVPVALELAISGADLRTWHHNVFALPEERLRFLGRLLEPKFYVSRPHNFYPSVWLFPAPLIAIGLSLGLGVALAFAFRRGPQAPAHLLAILALLATSALAAAALALMATNIDIVFVNFAVVPVVGWALLAAARDSINALTARRLFATWALATGTLASLGWSAAWQGSRALYGDAKAHRAQVGFQSADDLPAEFRYFRGTRLAPKLHESFRSAHALMNTIPESERRFVYFTSGTDWLERVWPETTTSGLPLWLALDVSYRRGDWARILAAVVASKQASHIFTVPLWENFPRDLKVSLEQRFRPRDHVEWLRTYERTAPATQNGILAEPIPFLFLAQSNVMTRRTWSDQPLFPLNGPMDRFVGNSESTAWHLDFSSFAFSGVAVALLSATGTDQSPVGFRIVSLRPDGEHVLWSDRVTLTADQPAATLPFLLQPGGFPLRLETEVPRWGGVLAGWQKLISTESGPPEENPPIPILDHLAPLAAQADLFADAPHHPSRAFGRDLVVDGDTVTLFGPGEIWSLLPAPTARLRGRLEVPLVEGGAEKVYVRINWYKAGRLEFFVEENLEPGTERDHLAFDRPMAEPTGWIGVQVRASDGYSGPVALRFQPFERQP